MGLESTGELEGGQVIVLNICALVMVGLLTLFTAFVMTEEEDPKTRSGLGILVLICALAIITLSLDISVMA